MPLACCLAMPMAACGASNQPQGTMDLLRAGNSAVCVAPDVQETLRSIIRPKQAEAYSYTISFPVSSLRSFDPAVSKAECNATIKVAGPGGTIVDGETIDYTIAPDAADRNNFVITANGATYSNRLEEASASAEADRLEKEADELDRRAAQVEQENRAAMIKPGWLIGRWVKADQGSRACLDGPYLDFGRRNVLRAPQMTGSWRLQGATLQLITPDRAATYLITQADALALEFSNADGPVDQYRRCTQSDAAAARPAPVEGDAAEATPPTSPSAPTPVTPLPASATTL